MPVLDTSYLIAMRQGDEAASRMLDDLESETLHVPAVVAAEYLTGLAPSERGPTLLALQSQFSLAHTSPDWIATAAEVRANLRGRGRVIRSADLWIACWATLHDTYVVTRNVKDFETLGVEARSW
jgi:predicted nucleic acid-binding protein